MSTYLNFSIQTRDQLKQWVMRRLGYPLVQVEVTEDQLDDAINESVEMFGKYYYGDEKYYALDLQNYPTSGYTMDSSVASVYSISESNLAGTSASGGINLFI